MTGTKLAAFLAFLCVFAPQRFEGIPVLLWITSSGAAFADIR